MPQSNQTGEFNTFVGGLVTEASPLTFPENASIDEANFELDRNGSRSRRLGMDYEEGLTPYAISYSQAPLSDAKVVTYEWSDVAGIENKSFVVVQIHDKAYIIDRTDESLKSQSYVKSVIDLDIGSVDAAYASFAAVDGRLVIAFGKPELKVISYDDVSDSFTEEDPLRLKIRDLFGVEDKFTNDGEEIDLLSPEYLNFRPRANGVAMDEHIYNLRNQGWAVPRANWREDEVPVKRDAIDEFEYERDSRGRVTKYRGLPSNADSPIFNLYPNTAMDDKDTERFNSNGSWAMEPQKSRAATGHFVIDLLQRGVSREEELARLSEIYSRANGSSGVSFRTPTVSLPQDETEGGAKVVAEFAGRVFYAGFSSKTVGEDNQSPNLASYVFYSQLVKDKAQIGRCYQEGDPTGPEAPDLLDTDGGFVRLAGAYNIQSMVAVQNSLMVFAENGVWSIGGSDQGSFSANNQSVTKITEHGTVGSQSVVLVDGGVMYWSDDAIYYVVRNQVGNWGTQEISTNIRSLYQSIGSDDKKLCQGSFDNYSKKARWLYSTGNDSTDSARELVFDLVLSAFYPSIIGDVGVAGPVPVAPIEVSPFNSTREDLQVVVGTDSVVAGTDNVVVGTNVSSSGYKETAYLTLINKQDPANTSITFSTYRDSEFVDWFSYDNVGVDSPAFLITGYLGNGDMHRQKQVSYVYFHFKRTEDGFLDDGDDLIPTNQSSCLVQSQWDWANSATYGKWGKEFQAYRYRRHYTPEDVSDSFDYGTETIVSRNKLRGRGRVVSLSIKSEPRKDMKLLGWSMTIGMNSNG